MNWYLGKRTNPYKFKITPGYNEVTIPEGIRFIQPFITLTGIRECSNCLSATIVVKTKMPLKVVE